mgnify:CR=1 FL=1
MKTGKKLLTGMLLVLFIVFVAGCGKAAKTDAAALPEVRNNGTAIQWRYPAEEEWHDLVALSELRGAAGENGKNGTDGKDGVDGINGTDGKDGINGIDGKNGLDGKDGIDGKDGVDGKNGADGKDGINGTDGKDGVDGKDGINGVDGKDGADGKNGKDGKDGINGVNGKSIEVQRTTEYIQWRYEGDEWQNLVAIADITGPAGQKGADGTDGKTPEFRVSENILQWRYVGDEIWLNLYDLTALKGADGRDGKDGKDGINGQDGRDGADGTNGTNGSDGKDGKTPFIGENGNWWIGEIDTGIKAAGTDGKDGINGIDGTNGKEIEIQKTDLYIQWRYKGGEWQNLVALADILGPSGQNGTNGEDGRTPEFRVNGNQLQWRYEGETIWLNLYDLSVLKGADGKDGSCAGYFAANGSVYSAGKALPFTVKKKSGGLISYNASSNKITLSKGHTYSLVFSGTIAVSAKSDGKACGAALFDGYNSEMALETQTYVTAPKADQTEKLTMAYNTIYTAEEDITLTFQYTTMLLQDTNFKDARYNITIIALD